MRAVGVQLDIVWENKQANFAKVRELLQRETVAPGSLIVLSEMFAAGFSLNVNAICEEEKGETWRFLRETAQRYQSYVVGGIAAKASDGRGRNEAAVFDPSGNEIVRYRKLHPFSYMDEDKHYIPGERVETFRCGEFVAAPFVCYDLRFPEIFRCAIRKQADLLIVIACWPQAREAHWKALLKARAIENQAYVIGVNRCGKDPKHTYSGCSAIIDPRGEPLAEAGDGEKTIAAELDYASLADYRREFPALKDMRREFFNDIAVFSV
ncbi:MAG: carbon-nitrogen family hydrolase [Candidatus Omnitrophota bacterium]